MEKVKCEITKEQIYLYAEEFRTAIEKVKAEKDYSEDLKWWFDRFPKGRCGDTSELLANYFLSKGISVTINSNGVYNGKSHAWVEYNGNYIIDITADQFPDKVGRRVIMTEIEDPWYCRFNGGVNRLTEFHGFSDRLKECRQKEYSVILSQIINK